MSRQPKLRPEDAAEISRRMRAVRAITGLSQEKFAKRYGFGKSQWTQAEGGHRLGIDGAIRLVQEMRLTLDWIYLGDPAMMPSDTLDAIRLKMAELDLPRKAS
jgi:transcriptional regulator with XRE-family HTH domain